MREALDAYTLDKGEKSKSLGDLVEAGYIKAVPIGSSEPQERDPIPPQEGIAGK